MNFGKKFKTSSFYSNYEINQILFHASTLIGEKEILQDLLDIAMSSDVTNEEFLLYREESIKKYIEIIIEAFISEGLDNNFTMIDADKIIKKSCSPIFTRKLIEVSDKELRNRIRLKILTNKFGI